MLKKKNEIIIVMLVCCLLLSGCSEAKRAEIITVALQEKYKTKFNVENVVSESNFSKRFSAILHPEHTPNLHFVASIDITGKNETDNYNGRMVCMNLANMIYKNMEGLYGDYCINVVINSSTTNINANVLTYEQYHDRYPGVSYDINLFYYPSKIDLNNFISCIANSLNELGDISGKINVYLVGNKSFNKIKQYLDKNYQTDDSYESNIQRYYRGSIEFSNGELITSKKKVAAMLQK